MADIKIHHYHRFFKKGKKHQNLNVIFRLLDRKNNLEKVGDIYHKMELVIRKEMKYVLLKMNTFYHKYLWATMKSLEIWYA
jgi:hypothetical protein